jgi:transcription antitermination factor NusG
MADSKVFNSFREGWYVMYTMNRHEKKIREKLSEREITSFLPIVKKLRIWRDRKKYVDEPLFPSYIFVHLKDKQGYFSSLDVEGVLFYVRTGKVVSRISNDTIHSIKELTERGQGVEVYSGPIQEGQQMVIREGPLTGLACEAVQLNGKQKISVRVHLLNRIVIADLPFHAVALT